MDDTKLALANELQELIEQTEDGLETLIKAKSRSKESVGGLYGRDNNYNLCICEFADGSGFCADLARYLGNTKILDLIIEELKTQLAKYKEDYQNL